MKEIMSALTVAVTIGLGAGGAAAHSFNVGVLLPADKTAEAQAIDGFMFAARERDGHPDEESDGHLGGLDVYILRVDAAAGTDTVLATLDRLVAESDIRFITGIAPAELRQAISERYAGPLPAVAFGVAQQDATTMDGAPFAPAFAARFGAAPTDAALQAYAGARFIDRVVRRLGDNFEDIAAVRAALASAE